LGVARITSLQAKLVVVEDYGTAAGLRFNVNLLATGVANSLLLWPLSWELRDFKIREGVNLKFIELDFCSIGGDCSKWWLLVGYVISAWKLLA